MAFDTIMVFQDRFKAHILPDKIHMLNVSFLVPQLRREFGGCAGNIAFNLNRPSHFGHFADTLACRRALAPERQRGVVAGADERREMGAGGVVDRMC